METRHARSRVSFLDCRRHRCRPFSLSLFSFLFLFHATISGDAFSLARNEKRARNSRSDGSVEVEGGGERSTRGGTPSTVLKISLRRSDPSKGNASAVFVQTRHTYKHTPGTQLPVPSLPLVLLPCQAAESGLDKDK